MKHDFNNAFLPTQNSDLLAMLYQTRHTVGASEMLTAVDNNDKGLLR